MGDSSNIDSSIWERIIGWRDTTFGRVNSDDADAMIELVDTVQYGLDACLNYVTSYTDTSLDFKEMQQEVKSILNKAIARLKKRVLSRSERKAMKIYANATHHKSEVSWLRSLLDKAKKSLIASMLLELAMYSKLVIFVVMSVLVVVLIYSSSTFDVC